MTAEVRLVDANELRRRIEADARGRDDTPWRMGWLSGQRHAIALLDAMPSVAAPKGWTRDEVLAELAKHPDNVCEALNPIHNEWEALTSFWIEQWHPEVRRFDVRVVRSTPDPEWVPLTKLVGRTIDGCDKPCDGHPTYDDVFDNWMWRNGPSWMIIPRNKLNLDTAQVLVLAEGER